MDIRIHDVKTGIPLDDDSVDAIITSPPYFGLRAYGDDPEEIGKSGQTLEGYLKEMHFVMMECFRVLKPTGLMWLNIGDSASGSGGAGGDYNAGGSRSGKAKFKQGDTGLPKMTWCNVPARMSTAMVDDGWLLRSEIIWDKGIERREDLKHVRRVRPAHEMIYCMAKSRKYRWVPEALKETGSVWHFSPSSGKGRGPAPFPLELPERCLAPSGIQPGDLVIDPFVGSGTTLVAAEGFEAKAIGFDLYDYREII